LRKFVKFFRIPARSTENQEKEKVSAETTCPQIKKVDLSSIISKRTASLRIALKTDGQEKLGGGATGVKTLCKSTGGDSKTQKGGGEKNLSSFSGDRKGSRGLEM